MSSTETTETPTVAPRQLHRSRDDRVLAGVAGGLGRYFDLTPFFFRAGFVILTLIGGAGILLYVAAALVIPDEGRSDSIATEALRRHRDRPWLLAGVALVGVALVSLFAQADFWPNSGFAWTLLLLGGIAIVVAQRRGDSAPADAATVADGTAVVRTPRKPSLLAPVVGVLLAGAGVLALLAAVGVDIRWDVALAVGAIATGLAVVAGWILSRRTGGLVVVGLILALLAVAVSAIDVRLSGPIGSRTFRPTAAVDVERDYQLAIGELDVDLSDTALAPGETRIDANVGVGELVVTVPYGVDVVVDATASVGEVTALGREDSGADAHVAVGADAIGAATRSVHVDAHVGIGDVLVVRG